MKKLSLLLVSCLLMLASQAHAGFVTFTDRGDFETFAGNTAVDDLLGVSNGLFDGFTRDEFSYTGSHFGCVDGVTQCGDNSAMGFDYPGYVWMYETGMFEFNTAISAFGLDLGVRNNVSVTFALNGLPITLSRGESSFFGFSSDDGSVFSQITISGVSSGDLFDNVTYSSEPVIQASSPSILALFGLAFVSMLMMKKRR